MHIIHRHTLARAAFKGRHSELRPTKIIGIHENGPVLVVVQSQTIGCAPCAYILVITEAEWPFASIVYRAFIQSMTCVVPWVCPWQAGERMLFATIHTTPIIIMDQQLRERITKWYRIPTRIATFPLTRAPPGEGVNITPLRDIHHSSKTVRDIDMKLSVPYGTTILRLTWKFCANQTENFEEIAF